LGNALSDAVKNVNLTMTSMARLARQVNTLCTRSRPSTYIFSFSHGHHHKIHAFGLSSRPFVTHQDAASSLLSSALDQKQRGSRQNREDSVGPFTLGISQGSLKGKKVKQWSELSTGGKGAHEFSLFLFIHHDGM
jgi:import inner membrane translocase subunit TIM21